MSTFVIPQSPSLPGQEGTSIAGASVVDITPHFGLPMAGYSTMSKSGEGRRGRLNARCLYLHEDAKRRVALCVIDQMSASRYLLAKVAQKTRATCGLSVDCIVLAGTHTHKAPGNYYGNPLYDALGQNSIGFDQEYADWLAERIASCIDAAVINARPASVGYAAAPLWGVSRNRSFPAFLKNLGCTKAKGPTAAAPPWLPQQIDPHTAIDPRVRVVAAYEAGSENLIGALATFGCHATTIPHKAPMYSADWMGDAQPFLRQEHKRAVIAIGASGGGDVTAFDEDHANSTRYFERSRQVGQRVAGAILAAIEAIKVTAQRPITIDCRFNEMDLGNKRVGNLTYTELAKHFAFGVPTLGGSEESRSSFDRWGCSFEGRTSLTDCRLDKPQIPKVRAFGQLQGELARLLRLQPSLHWPLHSVSISGTRIVTVPGEPTMWAAWQIENTCRVNGDEHVMPLGWAGDYSGYFTTECEYLAQHYEGSSTLWGRYSTNHLAKHLKMVSQRQIQAKLPGQAQFNIQHTESNFSPNYPPIESAMLQPNMGSRFGKPRLSWYMPQSARYVPGGQWFVRLEVQRNGKWTPLLVDGVPFDDINHEIVVSRDLINDTDLGIVRCLWHAEFSRPASNGSLRAHVRKGTEFPGLTLRLV
ncbi:MAG: neutral/alkaline non-lysosomal ceramidase N-terminal domain-containing protein [Planctomycetes bacterium]|nr:neutral/alkaline non-lysosomal ceramidase N-terminal domain-containing protein [Planctomycetota bacterium]MCW8134409.1 neutral/alkaline non-lysosomal ceramidase N-terminal domain-containing protein [Planctomycetota bacterium]